jgi:CheY-like chemotaxis protein
MSCPASPSNRLIIVVEDNLGVLDVLSRVIHRLVPDYAVITAREELLVQIDAQQVRVAIVDYHLPAMDGLALIHALHLASPHMRSVLVIAHPDTSAQATGTQSQCGCGSSQAVYAG